MDQVTQQNAALVEEASAASEAMQDQAAKLALVVSVFKLDNTARRRAGAPAAPAARKAVSFTPRAAKPAQPSRIAAAKVSGERRRGQRLGRVLTGPDGKSVQPWRCR